MAKIYTTEITSEQLSSDNPIHQRLFKAYVVATDFVHGNVLEVGCGEGRGVELMLAKAHSFTAVDKIDDALNKLRQRYPSSTFIAMDLPPLHNLPDNTYDCVVSFQVIEHIKHDTFYLKEINRVLKPGGIALITTPNRKLSLSRNPWHVREYLAGDLASLAAGIFKRVEMKGIAGNEKVMLYHEQNRQSVQRIMRWDIFNLQHRLPAWMLRLPYEWLNRLNRNKLQYSNDTLVTGIHHSDYLLTDKADEALDLFLIAYK
jgi:ubiquinone/menaquinone biosynthesis C-methylase UbiE